MFCKTRHIDDMKNNFYLLIWGSHAHFYDERNFKTFRVFVKAFLRQTLYSKQIYAHKTNNKRFLFKIESPKFVKYSLNYFSANFFEVPVSFSGSFSVVAGVRTNKNKGDKLLPFRSDSDVRGYTCQEHLLHILIISNK